MSLFEIASKNKYRFQSPKGNLTTEDLWDLPLTSKTTKMCLDDLAKGIHKQLKDTSTISFVLPKTHGDKELETKLEIIKHIIAVRMEEADARTKARENKQKRDQILSLIDDKKNEELKKKSIEELEAMIKQ